MSAEWIMTAMKIRIKTRQYGQNILLDTSARKVPLPSEGKTAEKTHVLSGNAAPNSILFDERFSFTYHKITTDVFFNRSAHPVSLQKKSATVPMASWGIMYQSENYELLYVPAAIGWHMLKNITYENSPENSSFPILKSAADAWCMGALGFNNEFEIVPVFIAGVRVLSTLGNNYTPLSQMSIVGLLDLMDKSSGMANYWALDARLLWRKGRISFGIGITLGDIRSQVR